MSDPADYEAYPDAATLQRHVLHELRRAMGWELTFLSRFQDGTMVVVAVDGPEDWLAAGTAIPLPSTFCSRMIAGVAPTATGRADDPGDPQNTTPVRTEYGIVSYSGQVIRRRDGSVAGTLCALDRARRELPEPARELGETLARLLAWELDREDTVAELKLLARTDPLTGLVNRRVLFEDLTGEVARAQRYGRPLSLVLLDLDHFKQVNDLHGHPVGDRVLCGVAQRLLEFARAGELVARLGGEEFGWVLPETGTPGALAAVERFREALAADPFLSRLGVTASVGVCELGWGAGADDLYAAADAALYAAKAAGRDRALAAVAPGAPYGLGNRVPGT